MIYNFKKKTITLLRIAITLITFATLISFIGCSSSSKINPETNKQNTTVPAVSKNPTTENGKQTTQQDIVDDKTTKQSSTKNTDTPVPTSKSNSTKNNAQTPSSYSKYTGQWVTENNLRNDFKYGIAASLSIDNAGNLQGSISDASENASHISNVNINGKIQDNKFTSTFAEDGWEHSGTITLDFKENQIILTIKYSSNSSQNNLWGIGEGTFTLINNTSKITRTLEDLKAGGLQVIENQCFSINLKNYGSVKLISGNKREDCNTIVVFYLVNNKNNVLYKLPDFYGNQSGRFNSISAISFSDVNNDGLKDILVITNYENSKTIASVYFQKGSEFLNDKTLDAKINSTSHNKDIATLLKFAKENSHK